MNARSINKGVLQQSILKTRRARHQTHSQDVQQATRHSNITGIWINGGTDETTGRHVHRISRKERQAVESFLAIEEREIARKFRAVG